MTGPLPEGHPMAEWTPVIVAAISAASAFLGAWLLFRAKARDDKQLLIDQLQEERALLKGEGVAYRAQIDKHWQDKALSREHVAALRHQVWSGGNPPPVAAPPGYVE